MKKTCWACLFFATLISCTSTNSLQATSKSSSSENTTSIDKSQSFDSADSSILTTENVITSEPSLNSNTWDESIQSNLKKVVKDYELPFFKAIKYSSQILNQQDVDYVEITCQGINQDSAEYYYREALKSYDFQISETSEDNLAIKEVSLTENMYVQFFVNNNTFIIDTYLQVVRQTHFPNSTIKSITGFNIPELPAETYECFLSSASNGNTKLGLYAKNVITSDYENYQILLKNDNYIIKSYDQDFIRAENQEKQICIQYYHYSDTLTYLEVYSLDLWPSATIIQILGENLPRYEKLDDVSTSTVENKYFCIYLDNTTSQDFEDYTNLLIEAHWEKVEAESEELNYYFHKKINDLDKYIQVVYSTKYQCICIALNI